MNRRRAPGRDGFSLLEAIIAAGLFVAAVSMLGQLLRVGLLSVQSVKDQTVAQLRCQSKLDELSAGLEPLAGTPEPVPFADAPHWRYRIELSETPISGLVSVTVTVEHFPQDEETSDVEYRLSRWLRLRPERVPAPVEGPTTSVTIAELLGLKGHPSESRQ